MYQKKKEKLYIDTLVEDPAFSYPSFYMLSSSMAKNEMLHAAIIALHTFEFDTYRRPTNFDELFKMFSWGGFPLYKEKYAVGFFGQKMMYLESNGWKAMPATADLFKLENWLIY
jgi:hypothetical protein